MNKKRSTLQEKINWLLKHQDLWYGISYSIYDEEEWMEYQNKMKKLIKGMRAANLYSPATNYVDIGISVRKYIHKARKYRRENM
jgi:hypothetical protein